MSKNSIILRFDDVYHQSRYSIQRLWGTVDAKNFAKLITVCDLRANPRESKVGEITDAIQESLKITPDLFQFKSKGMLVSTKSCRHLDRNRFELTFQDEEIEGILDGGHNALALALHLLSDIVEDPRELRKVRIWNDLRAIWKKHQTDAIETIRDKPFLVQIEVLYPLDGKEDDFERNIFDISQARNNNSALTEETKANKAGYYEELKQFLDPVISNRVEWKANTEGELKAKDLVALTMIPLSLISVQQANVQIDPVIIYSSKGKCVEIFNRVYESDQCSRVEGATRKLTNETVRSALAIMDKLPRLYDTLYQNFPEAYNKASPGFGRISCVKSPDAKKEEQKISASRCKTKFYEWPIDCVYPDPFILPILFGTRQLLKVENDKVVWRCDPFDFFALHLVDIVRPYQEFVIKMAANYDPQKVGKSSKAYEFVEDRVDRLLNG